MAAVTTIDAEAQEPRPQRDSAPRTAERGATARDVVIPFTVGAAACTDRARAFPVTIRIYNVLAQPVGVATLGAETGGGGAVPPGAAGRTVNRLMLPCGRYVAHWDGRHAGTGRRLAPGVYLSELVIDGQRVTHKITLGR